MELFPPRALPGVTAEDLSVKGSTRDSVMPGVRRTRMAGLGRLVLRMTLIRSIPRGLYVGSWMQTGAPIPRIFGEQAVQYQYQRPFISLSFIVECNKPVLHSYSRHSLGLIGGERRKIQHLAYLHSMH